MEFAYFVLQEDVDLHYLTLRYAHVYYNPALWPALLQADFALKMCILLHSKQKCIKKKRMFGLSTELITKGNLATAKRFEC